MPVQVLSATASNFGACLTAPEQVLGAAALRTTADTIYYGLARIALKGKFCFVF